MSFLLFLMVSTMMLTPLSAFAQEAYVKYEVCDGDSLSKIIDKFQLAPRYNRSAQVRKLIGLNHGKIDREGALIWPGDHLLIPFVTSEALKYGTLVGTAKRPQRLVKIKPPAVVRAVERKVASTNEDALPESALSTADPQPEAEDIQSPTPQPSPEVKAVAEKPAPRPKPRHPAPVASALSEPKEFTPFSKFDFSMGAGYLGLFGTEKSNQTSARLLSGLAPSFGISWQQIWSPKTSSKFYFETQSVQFEDDQTGVKLSHSQLMNSAFGFSVDQKLTSRLRAAFDFEMSQTLFYNGLTGGGLIIEQVPLLRLHPQMQLVLIKHHSFEAAVVGGVSYYGGSSYDSYSIQSGYGYDGALQISQEFNHTEFKCKMGYAERHQATTYLNLIEKDIGVKCALAWNWGAE